nr:MAG TPA: hypothetical protein [Caudoviricetes sp.]
MKVIQKVRFTSGARRPGKLKGFKSGLIEYVMRKLDEQV